ncbi:MAG: acylphosphatase [Luteimonas sp.]|nr:acylphosphatase [Luteimonas sp.]
MTTTARFLVSGKVQGVFFRASTREQARRLGLSGHARNLADGRVEVVASGADDAVEALAQWLQHGPPAARVDAVQREDFDADADAVEARGFTTG